MAFFPSILSVRGLLVIFIAVHVTRLSIIPYVAWLVGNEEYMETEKLIRTMGFKLRGPCSLPRPLNKCPTQDRLHIILVSAQWDREAFTQSETEVVVKSMLASTRCRIHFHFMVTGEEEEYGLTEMMEELGATPFDLVGPVPSKLVRHDNHIHSEAFSAHPDKPDVVDRDPQVAYTIHPIPVRFVQQKAGALGINITHHSGAAGFSPAPSSAFPSQAEALGINITHHSGAAGFSKLFLSEILWNVERAIYLDVDMLLAEDIGGLWEFFREFDTHPELLLFMGDNHPAAFGPRARHPFCSCQLIMDLGRLRAVNFTRLVVEAFGEQKAMEVWGFRPGDQWVFTMMCMNNPERCRTLPKIWNVSGCSKPRFDGLNARDIDSNGSCWKTLHFNCMGVQHDRYYALDNTDWEDTRNYILNLPWSSLGKNLQ